MALEIDQMQKRELPAGWDRNLSSFPADAQGVAGREASGKVLNVLAQNVPWLLGGSADLGPSNKTTLTFEGAGDFQADAPAGRNLHFGIREHSMRAIVNGLALSKMRSFGAPFLSSATTPDRLFGLPHLWSYRFSMCSHTTPWATEKTVQPISRLNIWLRCGPFQD
jgi:transketolase